MLGGTAEQERPRLRHDRTHKCDRHRNAHAGRSRDLWRRVGTRFAAKRCAIQCDNRFLGLSRHRSELPARTPGTLARATRSHSAPSRFLAAWPNRRARTFGGSSPGGLPSRLRPPCTERQEHDRVAGALSRALGERVDELMAHGAQWSEEAAVALALRIAQP